MIIDGEKLMRLAHHLARHHVQSAISEIRCLFWRSGIPSAPRPAHSLSLAA